MPTLLKLVPKTDPILRQVMPEEQNFKDPILLEAIENMRHSILPEQLKAAHATSHSAAGMAANQWGIARRVFVFTPDGSAPENRSDVMINPSYAPYLRPHETEYKLVSGCEGCFSIPLTVGLVNRYDAIIATYYTLSGEKIERLMEDWEARVFQHETDHLDGKLYDGCLDQHAGPDCLDRLVFDSEEEMKEWIRQARSGETT